MRKILVIVLMLASAAFALPDLQVRELQYSSPRLVANIFNQAPDGINESIEVKFYDNGREIGTRLYTDALPRYSVFSAYIDYTPPQGMHNFKAVADEENKIKERNENNNDKSIQFEQKTDTAPRNVTPERVAQEEKKKETREMPQSSNNTIFMLVIAVIILSILLLIRILHLKGKLSIPRNEKKNDGRISEKTEIRERKRRFAFFRKKEKKNEHGIEKEDEKGFLKMNQEKKRYDSPEGKKSRLNFLKRSPAERKGVAGVKQAMAMKPGSAVSMRARLIFNGKVGDEYTYFVKDSTGEAVGVSKEKYAEKECMLECTVESFMKDDKVLRIHSVKCAKE